MDEKKLASLAENNSFAKYIGLEIMEVKEGYAKGRIHMEEKHKNIYDSMHGGCSYTMADTMAGIAASTYGNYVTTINGTMNYLRPVADTEYVYCEAKVARQGATIGVYNVEITNDKDELLCTAVYNYFRLNKVIE